MFESLFQKYGSIVRLQLRGSTVLVRDIKDVETVFRNEGIYPKRPSLQLPVQFAKRNGFKEGFNDLLLADKSRERPVKTSVNRIPTGSEKSRPKSCGLGGNTSADFTMISWQGKKWQELRSPISRRLARVNSATYYILDQNPVADDFREVLENADDMTPEALSETFFKFAAESIGVVCFNTRLGFLNPNFSNNPDAVEYLKASKAVFEILHEEISGRSIMHGLYRNKTYRDFEATQLTLRHHSGREIMKAINVLKEKQQNGTFDPEEPNLLFSLLSDPNIDFETIRTLMNTLYVAGTDSTAKSLQIFFFNLAMNPEKQEILYREINEVLGPDQPLTAEALARMPYLKAAVKESFRTMFPNMGVSRFMPRDIVLSGYQIPAGTHILICSHSVSKAYFENPEQYYPERWLRSEERRRSDSYIHPMSVLPFGYGPRNCIGRRFAEQEIFLGSVKVLQKLKIGVKPESEKTKFIYTVFFGPEKPIAFTFSKR
ncbi:cytochrome P450 10-like [Elysia marginata]|uniref:Cytochrome P450 10-like n=1 Tax=Elysia marginata TaxID=1093978 RepID=A0AAV4GCT2_9GAST|nr:cytochrome P450 10-like [Elysia marginata]